MAIGRPTDVAEPAGLPVDIQALTPPQPGLTVEPEERLNGTPRADDGAEPTEALARLANPGRVWRIGDDVDAVSRPTHLPEARIQRHRIVDGRFRLTYGLLVTLWILANVGFWGWWLQPAHVEQVWLYVLFSVVYFYDVTFLPTMYLYFVGKMARPKYLAAQPGLKVALITLCVPSSESIAVIGRQLEALMSVRYPHDSWVLDEGGDPHVRALAERLGVRYFTRKGVEQYNQPVPPFKAKTKAGNVNAWIDQHGHEYEFFVQFDIDHRPNPTYLDRVLGYFRDPAVAWVQGPSLYNNLDNWVARASAEQELVLQGPLQAGFFGSSETPFIIGSHCSYRTRAIQEIGGFQPTRAEDHLDTVMLAARGYRGAFVPEVLAVGNGPDTFETYLRQQFAWSYSLMQVMFTFTPRLVWSYRPIQAIQFLFAQTWYACWSLSMALLFLIPAIALVTDSRPSGVGLTEFLAASLPVQLVAFAIWWWTRRWHLPCGLRLSWRGVVLHVARWPIVLWAFVNVVFNVKHPYMITPKGVADGLPTFSLRSQALYLGVTWLVLTIVWLFGPWDPLGLIEPRRHDNGSYDSEGFIILALWGVVFVLMVFVANLLTDLIELRRLRVSVLRILRLRYRPLGVFLVTVFAAVISLEMNAHLLAMATHWDGASAVDTAVTGPNRAVALLREAAGREALEIEAPASLGERRVGPSARVDASGLPADRVMLGAYDPWETLQALPIEIDHWYVSQSWPWLTQGALRQSSQRAAIMLSFGPSPRPLQVGSTLREVAEGRRDAQLRRLARVLARTAGPAILLRWAPNMDLAGLEPWGGEDPALYREAYRHVVELFRAEGATNVHWVWSPSGQSGLAAYYPGDDVVDYVGLSIFEDEGWDAALGTGSLSFVEHLEPLYARVEPLGKPIIIAELGVSGAPERQRGWLAEAAAALPEFPLVRAVSYYADVAPATRFFTTTPEWRIEPDVLEPFVRPEADRRRDPSSDSRGP